MAATTDEPAAAYRFTHSLNASGDRIRTVDDPQIARLKGEGIITESSDERPRGEWRLAFRTQHPNRSGLTDCRWIRKGKELFITRQEQINEPQDKSRVVSELKLRRRAGVAAVP